MAVGLGALYLARRPLAEAALSAWLRDHGAPGEVTVLDIGPTAIAGRVRFGDPARPDLTIERLELAYGWRGPALEVRTVTVSGATLRARLHAGRLSVGALDPLVAELRRRPPSPSAASPRIVVRGGRLMLATDAGALDLSGDAEMAQGRLARLQAVSRPTRLALQGYEAQIGAARLSARSGPGGLELSADAPVAHAAGQGVALENGRLRLAATMPYPDGTHGLAGPVVAHAELTAASLSSKGQALRSVQVSAGFTGQAAGTDPTLAGRLVADVRSNTAEAGGGQAQGLRGAFAADRLTWSRKGGLQAQASASAMVDRYVRGGLSLRSVTGGARGPLRLGASGFSAQLQTSALGKGAWRGEGAAATGAGAPDSLAVLRRAAAGFRFAAPAVGVRLAGADLALSLPRPVILSPDSGGAVTIAHQGGGLRVTSAGGGLPPMVADIDRLSLVAGGASAHGRVRATLSVGPVRSGVFDAAGVLRLDGAGASFAGDRCARFDIDRLELGPQDLRRLAGQLCPAGRPLLAVGQGWRLAGRVAEASADLELLQARLTGADGAIDLAGEGMRLSADLRLAGAQARDLAPSPRFNPVRLAGGARLTGGVLRGDLAVSDPAGRPLAGLTLSHAMASGRGGVEIATGRLVFAADALQPAALSPLAAAIGSPAQGEASFTGRFDWTPKGSTSSGVLEVPRLDFQSPAGAISGLSGRIVFASLAPLVAAPGQSLRVARITTPLGAVQDASLAFGLDARALTIAGGEAAFGGGRVRVEALALPLAPGAPIRGLVRLEGVELHDLVEASPFASRVDLKARVSGQIPFEAQGARVRITGGELHAVEPGRLSIQRTALTGVAASGAVAAPGAPASPEAGTDTFTDFAYQAMENLAFSQLDASVQSRPDGRLGVLFHIVGKHDPPQHQEIRLSIADLIGRKFLGRKLPLPSGTGVDLTLDTTLNLDDLLADYAEYRRLHGSAQVQP